MEAGRRAGAGCAVSASAAAAAPLPGGRARLSGRALQLPGAATACLPRWGRRRGGASCRGGAGRITGGAQLYHACLLQIRHHLLGGGGLGHAGGHAGASLGRRGGAAGTRDGANDCPQHPSGGERSGEEAAAGGGRPGAAAAAGLHHASAVDKGRQARDAFRAAAGRGRGAAGGRGAGWQSGPSAGHMWVRQVRAERWRSTHGARSTLSTHASAAPPGAHQRQAAQICHLGVSVVGMAGQQRGAANPRRLHWVGGRWRAMLKGPCRLVKQGAWQLAPETNQSLGAPPVPPHLQERTDVRRMLSRSS